MSPNNDLLSPYLWYALECCPLNKVGVFPLCGANQFIRFAGEPDELSLSYPLKT